MASGNHTDFVLTIGGKDVTRYCYEWLVIDDEKDMSSVTALLRNPGMVNSGLAVSGDTIALRFGLEGDLAGKIEFAIQPFKEAYPADGELSCSYTGTDPTRQLAGGEMKGCFDDELTAHEAAKRIVESEKMKAETGMESPEMKDFRYAIPNQNKHQAVRMLGKASKAAKSKPNTKKAPKSPINSKQQSIDGFNGQTGLGSAQPGAGLTPAHQEEENNLNKNRLENDRKTAGGEPVKAVLELVQYPWLKAKATVQVLNVGPVASGDYYVPQVKHRWTESDGYHTEAQLIRSGTGKGGAGEEAPLVMYSQIYDGNSVYMGPRKVGQSPQASFSFPWGKGGPVIGFWLDVNPQQQQGGGEQAEANEIDLRNQAEAAVAEAKGSSASSAGGGA